MDLIIFTGIANSVADERRTLNDAALGKSFDFPFAAKQFKVLTMSQQAVDRKLAVGNHYHPKESGREEFLVVLGGKSGEKSLPACRLRYRELGGAVNETELMFGDACYVPAGWSHAFLPLRPGLQILGVSNKEFREEDDVPDKLF